jgi:adenylate cyclase
LTEPEVRQRLAAILAADVAGYSRLMGGDERATIATLNQFRAIFREHIEANQGRVVDMTGDSVLAIFETAAGAVLTGVAVQQALAEKNEELSPDRRMVFRIGVHLGDIHEQDDGTIYGDGVNVAARLENLAEPGSICVSDMARGAVKGQLDFSFADLGEQTVKNIAEPVRAYQLLPEGEAPTIAGQRTPKFVVAAVAIFVLAIAGVGWWQFGGAPEPKVVEVAEVEGELPPLPTGPAIAVLPFDNLSGDPEQEYFADGLAEDILTRLAAFLDLKVIARNSSFQYKGTAVDVREVGRELGADYVLEGSVRRDATSIRISAQLLDARDGGHVWAETYDRDLSVASVFAIQDEITEQVTAAIGGAHGAIAASGISRLGSGQVGDLRSYECVLLTYQYNSLPAPDVHKAARDCLEEVVVREPKYIEALAWLGHMYLEEVWSGFNPRESGPTSVDAAFEVLGRAVRLDPNHQHVRRSLAWAYYLDGDREQFFDEARKAIETNPNDVETLALMAQYIGYGGRWDESKVLTERLRSLTDNLPIWHNYTEFHYHYRDKDYAAAAVSARASQGIEHWGAPWYLALAYEGMGEDDKAMEALAKARAREPELTSDFVFKNRGALILDEVHLALLMEGHARLLEIEWSQAPSHPVIAVLPFDNLSGDPEQDFFADGISQDVLNQISPAMGIQVISRASSFRYRGLDVDASKAGAELGAQFLVLGSVRRKENAIRVTAELVEVETGKKVWSSAYDRTLNTAELFQIQDDISQSIVAAIADEYGVISQLTRQRTRQGATSLGSYECVLRAYHYFEYFTEANHLVARDCLEEAVQRDPQYAEAWGWLAILYSNEHLWQFNLREDPLGRSLRAADTAVSADRHSQMAWEGKAAAHFFRGDRDEFHRAAQKAISVNPNDVSTIGNIGWYYSNLGEYDQALPLMDKALSLSPFPPAWYYQPYWQKYYMDGDFEVALQFAIKAQIPFWYSDLMLASTHAQLGNESQAASNIQKLFESNPDVVAAYYPMANSMHWPIGFTEKVAEGLEKAGLQIPDEIGAAD